MRIWALQYVPVANRYLGIHSSLYYLSLGNGLWMCIGTTSASKKKTKHAAVEQNSWEIFEHRRSSLSNETKAGYLRHTLNVPDFAFMYAIWNSCPWVSAQSVRPASQIGKLRLLFDAWTVWGVSQRPLVLQNCWELSTPDFSVKTLSPLRCQWSCLLR